MDTGKNAEIKAAKLLAFSCSRRRTALETALLVLAGWSYTAIFEGIGFGIYAWIGLMALPLMVWNRSSKRAFAYGYIWGYAWTFTSFFWFREITIAIPVIFPLLLALFPAAWCAAVPFLFKNMLIPPYIREKGAAESASFYAFNPFMEIFFIFALAALWVFLDWIRSWLFTGLPWNFIGASQYKNIPVIQIAEFTGVYGITFLIVAFNTALFISGLAFIKTLENKKKYRRPYGLMFTAAFVFFMIALPALHHAETLSARKSGVREIKAGVIQPALSQRRNAGRELSDEALDICVGLTRNLLERTAGKEDFPDFIVWPETAVPYSFNSTNEGSGRFRNEVYKIAEEYSVPLVIGAVMLEGDSEKITGIYNSAILCRKNTLSPEYYSKTHIVPFGEYVPFGNTFPILNRLLGMGRNLSPGRAFNPLPVKEGVNAGVSICYEDVFPYVSRGHVMNGANFLMTITNDAWYPTSYEPAQHFANSVFRAVETRIPLLRVGNLDFSGVIDPAGRVTDSIMKNKDGLPDPSWRGRGAAVLRFFVPEKMRPAFYTLYGNLFVGLCFMIAVFAFAAALVNYRIYRTNIRSALKNMDMEK